MNQNCIFLWISITGNISFENGLNMKIQWTFRKKKRRFKIFIRSIPEKRLRIPKNKISERSLYFHGKFVLKCKYFSPNIEMNRKKSNRVKSRKILIKLKLVYFFVAKFLCNCNRTNKKHHKVSVWNQNGLNILNIVL